MRVNALRKVHPGWAIAGVLVMTLSAVWFALSVDLWPIVVFLIGAAWCVYAALGHQLREHDRDEQ